MELIPYIFPLLSIATLALQWVKWVYSRSYSSCKSEIKYHEFSTALKMTTFWKHGLVESTISITWLLFNVAEQSSYTNIWFLRKPSGNVGPLFSFSFFWYHIAVFNSIAKVLDMIVYNDIWIFSLFKTISTYHHGPPQYRG